MGFTIEPDTFYTEHELRQAGIFTEHELRRARERGLRCSEVARGQRLYKGQWLLDWLERPKGVARATS